MTLVKIWFRVIHWLLILSLPWTANQFPVCLLFVFWEIGLAFCLSGHASVSSWGQPIVKLWAPKNLPYRNLGCTPLWLASYQLSPAFRRSCLSLSFATSGSDFAILGGLHLLHPPWGHLLHPWLSFGFGFKSFGLNIWNDFFKGLYGQKLAKLKVDIQTLIEIFFGLVSVFRNTWFIWAFIYLYAN